MGDKWTKAEMRETAAHVWRADAKPPYGHTGQMHAVCTPKNTPSAPIFTDWPQTPGLFSRIAFVPGECRSDIDAALKYGKQLLADGYPANALFVSFPTTISEWGAAVNAADVPYEDWAEAIKAAKAGAR